MNAAELVSALGGRAGMARCPAHADRTPSLAIRDGHDGVVLVHCHGGCEQADVINALRSRGLWHDESPDRSETSRRRGPRKTNGAAADSAPAINPPAPDFKALLKTTPSDFWDYQDADGRLLGYTVRIDGRDGKKILPVTWDGDAWRCAGFPEPRPLYGLPALASRPVAPVLIVEGEKVACAAQGMLEEHVVITWPGGCEAAGKADWTPLKGRSVTIWPDADEPGRKAANNVAKAMMTIGAADIRVVKLPDGLPKGWDLADSLPEIIDMTVIERLLADAIDYRAALLANLPIKSAAQIEETEYPEAKWAVPGLIPDGVCILAGPKSRGKSFIGLDIAVAVAIGGNALGDILCEQGSVLYLALEDSERRIKGRTRAILQGRTVPSALDIAVEWRTTDQGGLDDIETWLSGRPDARLVVIDVLAKVKGRPDSDRGVYDQDYATIGPFHALARKHGIAVVLVHHTNKGSAADPVLRISGTMGLSGAADTTLVLSREARDMHGTLDVRGRDVPEREIALQFGRDTGCVVQLGPADDFRKTEERRAIIRALLDAGSLSPSDIAQVVGKKSATIRSTLSRMKKAGDITALADGKYQVAA